MSRGDFVFVPGARCFGEVRGLFGGAASRLVVPGARATSLDAKLGERGVLLALAATAYHAIAAEHAAPPDLIVGHGVLGRLLARLAVLQGASPVVWERNPDRVGTPDGTYQVLAPEDDPRRDYRSIYDVSGDPKLLDTLIARLARGGEVVLAGFYEQALSFAFPAAFMREARIRVAAEWRQSDLDAVKSMAELGTLSLEGLITHRQEAAQAAAAYRTAFDDPLCLKMILDWRTCS
jgi:3-hydroxyethyl bacteriochlorophyllide a dehydrogenase